MLAPFQLRGSIRMATPQNARDQGPQASLIGGQYAVDISHAVPDGGGGLDGFAVNDRHGARVGLLAVRTRDHAPARAPALLALLAGPVDHVMTPIAHGAAGAGYFVICPLPPGPPIWPHGAPSITPWNERALLDDLLRPAALALDRLADRRVTHRAIRPDNAFRLKAGEPVTLGMGWAGPPAALQPAVFEPPYVAACPPSARGEGSIADDVYALGVTLLTMAVGRRPMDGMDDTAIVRRKLEVGSYAALVGDARLPPVIADLLSGMLAEDPEHRPHPGMLVDPGSARGRRVAARPSRRAQRSLDIGITQAWTLRNLADNLGRDPEQGARLLRMGAVDSWLRRHLGDPGLAARLDEIAGPTAGRDMASDGVADQLLITRAVALLDPLAPLWWGGQALWPDGIGPALAYTDRPAGDPTRAEALRGLIDGEIVTSWIALRPERIDVAAVKSVTRLQRGILRQRGWGGGLAALRYALNPLLPCASPLLAGQIVVRAADILPALEAAATRPEQRRLAPIDAEIGGFLVGRGETNLLPDLAALSTAADPARIGGLQLRILAGLQAQFLAPPLPQLGAWLGELAAPAVAVWRSRTRRARADAAFGELRQTGNLLALLRLVDDRPALETDAREAQAALQDVAAIDHELSLLLQGAPARTSFARRIGYELTTALALTALTASAVMLAIGP
jgi:hypothetical protein